jgi:hypothetical protein
MIHVNVSRSPTDPNNPIEELKISVTKESLGPFIQMIDRALNCWDNAPKELKDFGDMVTHGFITQDHELKTFTRQSNSQIVKTGVHLEGTSLPICEYCGGRGEGHYYTCPVLTGAHKE